MPEPRVTQHSPMHPTGRLFAVVAFIEAVTWAGLLIGMWMKYGPMANVALVKLFGPLHGAAFLVYVAVTLLAAVRLRWPWWASALALLAAGPPLVTLPLEWWFKRRVPGDPSLLRLVFHARTSRRSRLAGAGPGSPDRHQGEDGLRCRDRSGRPHARPVRGARWTVSHGGGRVVDAGCAPVGAAQRPHWPQARADAGDECLHRGLHRAGGVHRCCSAGGAAGTGVGAGAGGCTRPDRAVLCGRPAHGRRADR
ncbi:hypothetical protein G6F65_016796 [Rhizopus arrhizus]|nr:hypothetical protein G6F65_016796 [Rhizopus arrhizus]